MLTWHLYAVILVPGLGLFATGRRRVACAIWAALAVASVLCPPLSALCFAGVLQLACILVSLRS